MALTAPQEAAVVTTANRLAARMPKRVSLPSMLPPGWKSVAWMSTPCAVRCGLPACSAYITTTTATTKISAIAQISAWPWRFSPANWPKEKHSAAGIRKIASICTKLVSAVGFSNGCAELALKKPPPLVPSILIASCEATGPIARDCSCVCWFSMTGWPWASLRGWPSVPSLGVWKSWASRVWTVL